MRQGALTIIQGCSGIHTNTKALLPARLIQVQVIASSSLTLHFSLWVSICVKHVPVKTCICLCQRASNVIFNLTMTHAVYQNCTPILPAVHAGIATTKPPKSRLVYEHISKELFTPTWKRILWTVSLLLLWKDFAQADRSVPSSCSSTVAAIFHILHWHHSEGGHLDSSFTRKKLWRDYKLGRHWLFPQRTDFKKCPDKSK